MKTLTQYMREDLKTDVDTNVGAEQLLKVILNNEAPWDALDFVRHTDKIAAKFPYDDLEVKMYRVAKSHVSGIEILDSHMRDSDSIYLIIANRMKDADGFFVPFTNSKGGITYVIGMTLNDQTTFVHEFAHMISSMRSGQRVNTSKPSFDTFDDYLTNHDEVNSFFQEALEFIKRIPVEKLRASTVEDVITITMRDWQRGPDLKRILKRSGNEPRRNSFYRRLYRLVKSLLSSL